MEGVGCEGGWLWRGLFVGGGGGVGRRKHHWVRKETMMSGGAVRRKRRVHTMEEVSKDDG